MALVHKRIKKIAVEMANVFYEEAAHDNLFYRMYKTRQFFVNKCWPDFIATARGALVECLGSDNLTEAQKEEVLEILIADKSLPKGHSSYQLPVLH